MKADAKSVCLVAAGTAGEVADSGSHATSMFTYSLGPWNVKEDHARTLKRACELRGFGLFIQSSDSA